MKILLELIVCAFLFTSTSFKSEGKGREVVIFLKASTEVKGELLAVRDSLVAIAVEPISADEDISAHPERVKVVKFRDVQLLRLEANNAAGIGFGAGVVFGAAAGSGDSYWGTMSQIMGGLLGGLLGGAVGMFAQNHTEEYVFEQATSEVYLPLKKERIKLLRAVTILQKGALFKDTEPRMLHETINNILKL